MLTDKEIVRQKNLGRIIIEPFDEKRLNPNSYNITLANKLLVYDTNILDTKVDNPTKEIIIPEEGFVLQPGILYLGYTNEYTETYDFIPNIDGRSSIGRLGIGVHITAGFGDIGYRGNWTLEITTIHPIKIYPNIEIGQLYYDSPTGEIGRIYNGKYIDSRTAVASRMHKDLL